MLGKHGAKHVQEIHVKCPEKKIGKINRSSEIRLEFQPTKFFCAIALTLKLY